MKKMQSKSNKKFRFSVGLDTELTLTLVVGLYIALGLDAGLGLDVGLGLVLELKSNYCANAIVVT